MIVGIVPVAFEDPSTQYILRYNFVRFRYSFNFITYNNSAAIH